MKIYARTQKEYALAQFLGKDYWVQVDISEDVRLKNYLGRNPHYIKIRDISDGVVTCNDVQGSYVLRYNDFGLSESVISQIFNSNLHKLPETSITIHNPLSVITDEEMIECLRGSDI